MINKSLHNGTMLNAQKQLFFGGGGRARNKGKGQRGKKQQLIRRMGINGNRESGEEEGS